MHVRPLAHAHETRDGVDALLGALDALESAPGAAAQALLPAPVVAPVAPAARHALVAVGAAADAALAAPRAELVTALDAAAAAGVDRGASLRVLDAFAAAARDAHATTREALAVLPRPPGAAAVAPLSRAAALLRRGALAGADVVDVRTCDDARALVLAARAACDVVVEARRRAAVVFFYDGDGEVHVSANTGDLSVCYGGGKESNTSRLIDFLRSLYDGDLAERRDNIEQLARDLYARGMGRLANFLGGLVAGQQGVVVLRLVPNTVGGRVEIKFQAPHAIDAMYTHRSRRCSRARRRSSGA